jgi:hypothetical protein
MREKIYDLGFTNYDLKNWKTRKLEKEITGLYLFLL